jgi:predicted nucleotidyltransferase
MAMNWGVNDPYLDTIVEILKPYDPERIILFGSRSRGEADELSDYDIIVIKRTKRSFLDRLQEYGTLSYTADASSGYPRLHSRRI